MAFWDRLLRSVSGPPSDIACSFCHAPRAQVAKLIAGPREIYICDGCVKLCAEILETPSDDRVAVSLGLVLRELAALPWPTDLGASRRLAEAALVLAEGDAVACRAVSNAARAVRDYESTALALARIPSGAKSARDALNEALFHDLAGAHELALRILESIDRAALDEGDRPLFELHRAAIRLAAGAAGADEARALEEVAMDARLHIEGMQIDDRYRTGLLHHVVSVRARSARLLGELVRAEAILREHLVTVEHDAIAWALLHDVHVDRGEHDRARVARNKALALSHPKSALAERLRAREIGPFR